MVTAVKTREPVEAQPMTLQELGEMIGVPVVVRPWWGSVRRSLRQQLMRVELNRDGAIVASEPVGKAKVLHLNWECPADGRNRKKPPEVRNGEIVLWEGRCGCSGHTHAQTIGIKSVARRAMLVSLHLTGSAKTCYLLGVDGERPYVVQVTRRPDTVKEALDWLMPKIVRRAIAQGLDVKRQGDWYFIPTNKEPKRHNQGINVPGASPALKTNILYRGANLVYSIAQTRHQGGLVVYQSVLGLPCVAPFVKGNVKAPDHDTLHLRSWHIAVRNRSHPWRNSDRTRRRFDD